MKEFLFENKIVYGYQKHRKTYIGLWLTFLFSCSFLASCIFSISLMTKTKAIYNSETNTLLIPWRYEDIDQIYQFKKVKINDKTYVFKIQNISNIELDAQNIENIQWVSINSPQKYQNNQVISIKLYDEEQKIIKKIIHLLE